MAVRRKRPRAGTSLNSLAVAVAATGASSLTAPLSIMSVQEETTRTLPWCTCHLRNSIKSSRSKGSNRGLWNTANLFLCDKVRRVVPLLDSRYATPKTWWLGLHRVSLDAEQLRPFRGSGRAQPTMALATSSGCCPNNDIRGGTVSSIGRETTKNGKDDCKADGGKEPRRRNGELDDELHRRYGCSS